MESRRVALSREGNKGFVMKLYKNQTARAAGKYVHQVVPHCCFFRQLVFGFLFSGKHSQRSDFLCASFKSPGLTEGIWVFKYVKINKKLKI